MAAPLFLFPEQSGEPDIIRCLRLSRTFLLLGEVGMRTWEVSSFGQTSLCEVCQAAPRTTVAWLVLQD